MSQVSAQNDNKEFFESTNPATGELIERYPLQSAKEAAQVVEDAHKAFLTWKETSLEERAKVIQKIADLLRKNKDELAVLMTQEMGKPIEQSKGEVDLCAQICEYTAKNGPDKLRDEHREIEGAKAIITYRPIGVLLAIEPWNFPLYQAIRYSIPNLLLGNTSALKHAQIVWGTARRMKEIYEEAGVTQGGFGVLYVEDEKIAALIEHPKVRGVTLTGSAAAGSAVAKKAGECLKKSVLELGGNDPYLVLEDAPLEKIIETCVYARTLNSGQTCICAKRFIVVESIYDDFRDRFTKAMEKTSYGDPTDPANAMGPLARADLRDKLHKQVTESIKQGAKCLLGGELPGGKGNFYPATVLENIKPGMPAYDEELFGPVASLIKVKDEAEAIEVANDTEYGLSGGVFTANEKRGVRIARDCIESGMVNVNGYNIVDPSLPFGGVKNSGYGREHGGFGLHEFANIKTIVISSD